MSTIRSFDEALDFHPQTNRPSVFARLWGATRTYGLALLEGLEAARTYQDLTRRGVPHDVAAQKVFGTHFRD